MSPKNVSVIRFQGDDMGPAPSRWNERGIPAAKAAFFWWGYVLQRNQTPVLLMRCFKSGEDIDSCGTLFHVQTKPGMFQRPELKDDNAAPNDCKFVPYHEIEPYSEIHMGPGKVYETLAEKEGKKNFLYLVSTQKCFIKEGDFAEMAGENVSYAACVDPPGIFSPYFQWFTVFKGTYYGKEALMLGGADRWYSEQMVRDLDDRDSYYIANIFIGIAEDGTKEYGSFYTVNGKSFAWYCKDGEEPRCSNNVSFEGKWVSDPTDPGLIAPEKLIWWFDDVKVHYQAEYSVLCHLGTNTNHGGSWYEEHGCRNFKYSIADIECNIKPSHVSNIQIYKLPEDCITGQEN